MHTNLNGPKMRIISKPKKSSCSEICCNSASKQRKSTYEVLNKTKKLWNSFGIAHSDIKALSFIKAISFSELSNQIGYILLKHPVE